MAVGWIGEGDGGAVTGLAVGSSVGAVVVGSPVGCFVGRSVG
eukprot:CAMPEP_0196191552 /NCGR_PEP_ID=MMETSP0911-20130528/48373_1 /TAXON_ID=49265 /ORGANISM="Thalassiosira rotula, Strain GSO102" /LENGTH=41 /DNA_ID= /DNA_START= /DNA_END= /DNA_ORIENTATION=